MHQFIAFSGGIDSTALTLLVDNAVPVFTDTGDEDAYLYEHLDAFERKTGRRIERIQSTPNLPEYELQAKFLPNHGARFCTRMFKIEPYNHFLAQHLPAELLIGLRADEPERMGNQTELDGLALRYPLREMGLTRLDCVKLCIEHDLLPRYPAYQARGGCLGCFYKRKSEIMAMHYLRPDLLDKLQEREETVQAERGEYFHMFPNVGQSIREFRAGLVAQGTLFDMAAIYAGVDYADKGAACGLFCHR